MKRIWRYLIEAVQSPREQLTRGQQFVRQSWQLTVYGYDQLRRHRAEGMAAELTYRTIFALVPLVVLGLVMFRVVGGLDEVQSQVENQLYSFFGVPEIPESYLSVDTSPDLQTPDPEKTDPEKTGREENDLEVPGAKRPNPERPRSEPPSAESSGAESSGVEFSGVERSIDEASGIESSDAPVSDNPVSDNPVAGTPVAGTPVAGTGSLPVSDSDTPAFQEPQLEAQASIRRTLREVTTKVATLDFKSIGVVGLLLFIYAAVALADSVEQIFNRIFDAPTNRPVHIRVAIHWSIITLGSGLLAMSLYMSGQVVQWFVEIGAGSRGQLYLSHLLSIVASWVLLFLLYALMPNTHVSVRAAGVGALVSATLWEAAKFGFQIYVAKALPYSAIYGSIGLIPLFLFWIYVTWMIVLFGLIVTYALQRLRGNVPTRGMAEAESAAMGDPDWALPIMTEIAMAFEQGEIVDHQMLADRLGLPGRVVHELSSKLIDHHFLRRVGVAAGQDEGLSLARPADKIVIAEILELAHRLRPTGSHPAWQVLGNLKLAERDAAGDQSLADLISRAATCDADHLRET